MRVIKTIILVTFLVCLLAFFSKNNAMLNIIIPFSEFSASMSLSTFSLIFLFIGSVLGFSLRKSNRRDYLIKEQSFVDEIKSLKAQKKIYESELKIQNQLKKAK